MKQRRQFLRKLGGLAALVALTSPGKAVQPLKENSTGMAEEELKGNFLHVVFFWLKEESEENKKQFLGELRKFIDNMEVIQTKHVGTPADTDRPVIDNTYSYCLALSFKSKKEHDIYQAHKLHEKFIANASDLWEKVLVYDSIKS